MINAPQWTSDRDDFLTTKGRRGRIMSVSEFNQSGFGREEALQVECVRWFRKAYPELEMLLVNNLNGADLVDRQTQWLELVKQGAVAGAPDLTLHVPSGDFGCLHIEMKTLRGTQRPSQLRFQVATELAGNAYVIPRSLAQFKRAVNGYLEGEMKMK